MNDRPVAVDALDERLRRTLGTLDVRPGFATRLATEIDSVRTAAAAEARAAARDHCRAARERTVQQLRHELGWRIARIAAAGAGASACAWLLRDPAARLLSSLASPAMHMNGNLLALASAAVLVVWLLQASDLRRSGTRLG